MATLRQLVDRWRSPAILPEAWKDARMILVNRFLELQRVLGVLHGAVEHMPVESRGRVSPPLSGSNTSITTTTPTDVTSSSTSYTPTVDTTAFITAYFCVQCTAFNSVSDFFRGSFKVNGTVQNQQAIGSVNAVGERRMIAQTYVIPLTSGTTYTMNMTGQTDNVLTTYDVIRLHSGWSWFTIPNAYKVP